MRESEVLRWKQKIESKFWPHLSEEIIIVGQK